MIEWDSTGASITGMALVLLVLNVVSLVRSPATRRIAFLGTLITLNVAILPIATMLPSQSFARRAVHGFSLVLMATALFMMAVRFPSAAAVAPGESE